MPNPVCDLRQRFLQIAKLLNSELGVTPVLYGSLGLMVLTGQDLNPQDIDILVPCELLGQGWGALLSLADTLSLTLVDAHEHEFSDGHVTVAFASAEGLMHFAGIDHTLLEVMEDNGARYKLLGLQDYLKVYKKSLQDSYRRDKNNGKDVEKIELIEGLLLGGGTGF